MTTATNSVKQRNAKRSADRKKAAIVKASLPRSVAPRPQQSLFPGGPPALANGRTHEAFGAAAHAFAAVQAGMRDGPLIWILPPAGAAGQERPDPYGLAPFLDPGRLILVQTGAEQEVFWAMEEALRSGAAPCVVAEAAPRGPFAAADLTRSRRLQLAAEAGGGLGLLLLRAEAVERAGGQSNAAETRWRADPAPSLNTGGAPVWEWRLLKNKRGSLGGWRLHWRGSAEAEAPDIRSLHDQSSLSLNVLSSQKCAPHSLALAPQGDGGARAAA